MQWEISSQFIFMLPIFTIQKAVFSLLKKLFTGILQWGTFKNTFEEFHNIKIDISMQIKEQKKFQIIPKRWVVERTFAWLNSSRRLSKDYEISSRSSECMITISHAYSLLKRLWIQGLTNKDVLNKYIKFPMTRNFATKSQGILI